MALDVNPLATWCPPAPYNQTAGVGDGGRPVIGISSTGELMRRSLETDFGVPVRWVEEKAGIMIGNARRSVRVLQCDGIVLDTYMAPAARSVCVQK